MNKGDGGLLNTPPGSSGQDWKRQWVGAVFEAGRWGAVSLSVTHWLVKACGYSEVGHLMYSALWLPGTFLLSIAQACLPNGCR